ncbi:hypothetical protein [Haloglycomyces albus]|uniref:hypothetical protein n=1 Tax=Haloglycomyces albus TaxID=526067 RepID=UPI0004B3E93B|nr:hypothetical protein [Haloglycomyces albus]
MRSFEKNSSKKSTETELNNETSETTSQAGIFASLRSRLSLLSFDKFKALPKAKQKAVMTGAAAIAFIGIGGPGTLALANSDHTEPATSETASEEAASGEGASEEVEGEEKDEKSESDDSDKTEKSEDSGADKAETSDDKTVTLHNVAGLDDEQLANAVTIIEAGEDKGISERGQAVALATAMQEAKMYNAASNDVPESWDHTNSSVHWEDHDSVGIFQQRPSMGWGSVEELMDVKTSADKFYGSLQQVSGWEDMSIAAAAQAVQVSAFPDAYAQWEDMAHEVVDAYHSAA